MKTRYGILIVLAALVALCVPANATVYTLTSGNSTVQIDSESQAGAYGWIVDGYNVLFQQWFWFGIGSGATQSLDTLPLLTATPALDDLTLTYGYANGLQVSIEYDLTGGSAGTLTSDIAETISINNKGTSAINFHFFQYSDFDLNLADRTDKVVIDPTLRLVNQVPVGGAALGPILSETVLTPKPSHAEAGIYGSTLAKLNAGGPVTLNDTLTAGPGDATWAFQWDKIIAAGGSFIISKDKNLAPNVPEPTTILGLGTILLLVGRKLTKKLA